MLWSCPGSMKRRGIEIISWGETLVGTGQELWTFEYKSKAKTTQTNCECDQ